MPSIPIRSQCFWIASNEVAKFSWEAVATGSVNGQTYRLAACTNTDPDTGQPVVIDSHPVVPTAPWSAYATATFQACHETYIDDNAYGDCRVSRGHCAAEQQPCGSSAQTNFPFCARNCEETPSGDTTYVVQVSSPSAQLNIVPTLYPVTDVRSLARQLTFVADPAAGTKWRWSVPSLARRHDLGGKLQPEPANLKGACIHSRLLRSSEQPALFESFAR